MNTTIPAHPRPKLMLPPGARALIELNPSLLRRYRPEELEAAVRVLARRLATLPDIREEESNDETV